jgi:osmotically inducible lipoprotein OsmB
MKKYTGSLFSMGTVAALVLCIGLVGCSTMEHHKQATGTVVGGVAGGVLGGAVSGGSALGVGVGAVGGALVGNEVGRRMH